MKSVQAFIKETGIGPEGTDAAEFMRHFRQEMERGAKKEESSLAMIPTYVFLSGADVTGRCAAAIDMGGTNLRTALVRFDGQRARLEHFSSRPTPGTEGRLSWQQFIDLLAGAVRPLMEHTDRLGICISFPTTITPDGDGIIHRFTKEVDIEGFEGRRVCRDLAAALGVDGLTVKALNDTTAVLLSGLAAGKDSGGLIGLINGTGTNICCQLPCQSLGVDAGGNMVVAVESGGFVPPDRNAADRRLDESTIAPGVYLEEKVVSGAYLGPLCRLALAAAAEERLFSPESAERIAAVKTLTTPEMDAFGSGGESALFANETDAELGREIVRAVFARSAKHIALSLTACMDHTLGGRADVTISADGSVLRKSQLFKQYLPEYMAQYAPGRNVEFLMIDDSTIIGTAIGALM